MKLCPPRHLREVAAHCSTPNAHPSPLAFPPSSTLIPTTWRQFDLIAAASSPAGSRCHSCRLNVQLPGQRVRGGCFCAATRILGSRANLGAPAAGLGLTPSSPGALGKQLLLLCRSAPARQGQMAAAQLGSTEHPGCCNNSPQTCSSARVCP